MKKLNALEWFILVQCFVTFFDGFYGTRSTIASAKHAQPRSLEESIRLLTYLDNENHIPMESLENLSSSKLIGSESSDNEDSKNSFDDISKLLQMDDGVASDKKVAPVIGNFCN